MSITPEKVEPGQVWRDNDERSKGAGEFTVEYVAYPWSDPVSKGPTPIQSRALLEADGAGVPFAVVHRSATGRRVLIRVDRLLAGKAYRYIGRSR